MKVGVIYDAVLALVEEDFRNLCPFELECNFRPQVRTLVKAGVAFLSKELRPWQIYLPNNIYRMVFKSLTPVADLEDVSLAIRERHFSEHDKAIFAINIMEKLHDWWVEDNVDFLLRQMERTSSMQYLCMPFWLLGFESAQRYLSFVEPLLRIVGLNTDRHLIRQVYFEKQHLYLMRYHRIKDISDLYEHVLNSDYAALGSKVREAITEADNAKRITDQIVYRNDERF